jgi:signal transduction histidine kinase
MNATGSLADDSPFNLSRRFLVLSFVSIAVVSLVSSFLLASFLKERFLRQDAEAMTQVVNSIAEVELLDRHDAGDQAFNLSLEDVAKHITTLPDVVRANVFNRDMRVIWSTNPEVDGVQVSDNTQLRHALDGELSFNSGKIGDTDHDRPEQTALGHPEFVEIYMPVRAANNQQILGVVEIYKVPNSLFSTIRTGQRLIWIAAAISGLFLYITLFWIVRRADHVILGQHNRLVESETLAAVGEMASAVAHGIRSPLASIRSSAELWTEEAPDSSNFAQDIISEVDRLEKWVRGLLTYSQQSDRQFETVDVASTIRQSISHLTQDHNRKTVGIEIDMREDLPGVRGDSALLAQALSNIIANALEASREGSVVSIAGKADENHKLVKIHVTDSGVGISEDQMSRIFMPFYTTKGNGLGVGLVIADRIVRRCGGMLEVRSQLGAGTDVVVTLPVVRRT